jgi:hypothetical protein
VYGAVHHRLAAAHEFKAQADLRCVSPRARAPLRIFQCVSACATLVPTVAPGNQIKSSASRVFGEEISFIGRR